MDHQLAIIAAAKKNGLDPARLSPAQYRLLAVMVRTPKELAKDSAEAVESAVMTAAGFNRVTDEVFDANMAQCVSNECGKFRELEIKRKVREDGKVSLKVIAVEPACDACNCQGKLLKSKCRNVKQRCPIDNPKTNLPYWDNRKHKSEEVK